MLLILLSFLVWILCRINQSNSDGCEWPIVNQLNKSWANHHRVLAWDFDWRAFGPIGSHVFGFFRARGSVALRFRSRPGWRTLESRWVRRRSQDPLHAHLRQDTQGHRSRYVFTDRQTIRQPRAVFIHNFSGKNKTRIQSKTLRVSCGACRASELALWLKVSNMW